MVEKVSILSRVQIRHDPFIHATCIQFCSPFAYSLPIKPFYGPQIPLKLCSGSFEGHILFC